jgi:RNA polymerase sigma factor (TIGR02999 family)
LFWQREGGLEIDANPGIPVTSIAGFAAGHLRYAVLDWALIFGTMPEAKFMAESPITVLLLRWRDGDSSALNELVPMIYPELRHIAARCLRAERPGHTLQTTALVHEAYMRLVDRGQISVQTRNEFYAIAQTFRRILVDHARKRGRHKRGGDAAKVQLDERIDVPESRGLDLLRLNDALEALSQLSPRQSQIVELKFFGGLEVEEIAEVIGVSPATVKRDWTAARAWLVRELQG